MDDAGAARGDRHPVAVPPDAGVDVEVGLAQPRPVVVAPDAAAASRASGRAPRARPPRRPGCGPARPRRRRARPSPRHDISPAVTGSQGASSSSAATKSVPPLMTCSARSSPTSSYSQRNDDAGSGEPVEPTERSADRSWSRRGVQAGLLAGQQVARAGAEAGQPGVLRELPQPVGVGPEGAAVVQHRGRADGEGGEQRVPHDPAGRGVPAVAVVGAEVVVQPLLGQAHEERAGVPVDQPLGQAGGAGGEHHPQRRLGVERRPARARAPAWSPPASRRRSARRARPAARGPAPTRRPAPSGARRAARPRRCRRSRSLPPKR